MTVVATLKQMYPWVLVSEFHVASIEHEEREQYPPEFLMIQIKTSASRRGYFFWHVAILEITTRLFDLGRTWGRDDRRGFESATQSG